MPHSTAVGNPGGDPLPLPLGVDAEEGLRRGGFRREAGRVGGNHPPVPKGSWTKPIWISGKRVEGRGTQYQWARMRQRRQLLESERR